MSSRFPRTDPPILDDLRAKLIENGRTTEVQEGFDPFPMVKLFTPDAGATWLITEAYPDGEDLRLFGLCDLGLGSPELGYVMLSEIENARGKLGLPSSATSTSRLNTGSAPTPSWPIMPA